MRTRFFIFPLLLLAATASQARADTMYKCVDAAGKVAYTSQPCQGKASVAKAFEVAAPLDNETLAATERERIRSLDKVKAGIARREFERRSGEGGYSSPSHSGGAVMPAGPKTARKSDSQIADEARARSDAYQAQRCARQSMPRYRGRMDAEC